VSGVLIARCTIEELSPLEIQLKEIEDRIGEEYGRISCSKAMVMGNEGAIQKLMSNIIHPMR
jgi:hypothetical protein